MKSKQTILIVDDQLANIQLLLEILKEDYSLLVATGGKKALEMLKNEKLPDLVLLDINMPDVDGFTVCEQIKQDLRTTSIPVVFVTAMNESIDEARGLELGAVDYLIKPVIPELVLARVKNHLELASYRKDLEIKVEEKTKTIISLNIEVEKTLNDTLFTLGEIAEHRSNETGFHVKRVSEYSYHLAKFSGLNESECEILRLASSLHDIGKMAIPDAILNKPAKLTFDEFEHMKKHAQFGYDMLKNSNREIFKAAAIVAITHHEKYNGTGYPNNLVAEDIHIYGRITALADVFDALGSDRCYKKAWEMDKLVEFLKENRGTHFDPKIIDLFFENFETFTKIRDQYQD